MGRKFFRGECRKVKYRSPAKARRALRTYGKKHGAKRIYRCPHHDEEIWHLTSKE